MRALTTTRVACGLRELLSGKAPPALIGPPYVLPVVCHPAHLPEVSIRVCLGRRGRQQNASSGFLPRGEVRGCMKEGSGCMEQAVAMHLFDDD